MVCDEQQTPLLVSMAPETLRQLMAEGKLGASDIRASNAQQRRLIRRWCLENLRQSLGNA